MQEIHLGTNERNLALGTYEEAAMASIAKLERRGCILRYAKNRTSA